MKGKTLHEFLDTLSWGEEMEFTYGSRNYLIQGIPDSDVEKHIVIYDCDDKGRTVYESSHLNSFIECLEEFKESVILDGKTIYELDDDITVVYG